MKSGGWWPKMRKRSDLFWAWENTGSHLIHVKGYPPPGCDRRSARTGSADEKPKAGRLEVTSIPAHQVEVRVICWTGRSIPAVRRV